MPRALAAGPLNVERYWSMIAVVKVSKRIIANAPYSASRCSPTSEGTAQQRQPQLRQHDAEEDPPGTGQPERRGRVFDAGVEAAERAAAQGR